MIRKTLLIFTLLACIVAISYAAYTERVYRPATGFPAPVFTLSHPDDTTTIRSLRDLRGRYVLLSFWSSADPNSRLRLKQYDNMAREFPDKAVPLVVLGVNFDRSRRLFDEIVRLDSLDNGHHIYASGENARRIAADYRLADGYRSYLINPQGQIIAANPSVPAILDAIGKNK